MSTKSMVVEGIGHVRGEGFHNYEHHTCMYLHYLKL